MSNSIPTFSVNQSKINSHNKTLQKLNRIIKEEKSNSAESYVNSSEEEDNDADSNDDDDYNLYPGIVFMCINVMHLCVYVIDVMCVCLPLFY